MLRNILPIREIAAGAIAAQYTKAIADKAKLIKVLAALEPIRPKIDLLQLAASTDSTAIALPIINRLGSTVTTAICSYSISTERYRITNTSPTNNTYSTYCFPKQTNKEMFFSILDMGSSLGFMGEMTANARYGFHPAWVQNQTMVDIGSNRFQATSSSIRTCRVITLNVKRDRFDCYTDKASFLNGTPPTLPNASPYNISVIRPQTFEFKGYAFGDALSADEVGILVDALSLW